MIDSTTERTYTIHIPPNLKEAKYFVIKKHRGMTLNEDGRELKVRGSPMYPCSAYRTDMTTHGIEELSWHWHEDVEVIFVTYGIVIININGEHCSLREGEGVFINSNSLHSARAASESGCILHSLVFAAGLLSSTTESVFEQRYMRPLLKCQVLPFVPFLCGKEWEIQASKCIRDAYDVHKEEQYGYELIVREKLSHMLYLIVTNKQSVIEQQQPSKDKDVHRVKLMLDYLHNNYADNVSLQQLSAIAFISERECLRCFKKTLGVSPMQYLLKYRVSMATQLLSDTSLTVIEICTQTGFGNSSHFARAFRHYMQCSPTDYRKRY